MLDIVRRILSDGGVTLVDNSSIRELPRPRRVEGHPFAQVGRLRLGSDGQLALWTGMDNLRGVATAAVGCCGALLR
jgi:N-acetyl-gamma-glutamylphosphate reductase